MAPHPEIMEEIATLRQIVKETEEVSPGGPEWHTIMDRRITVYDRLSMFGSEAVEPLIAVLTERSGTVSYLAAEALGRLKDPQAIKPLLTAFVDEINPVYTSVIARIGDVSAVEPLIVILENAEFLGAEHADQLRLQWLERESNPLIRRISKALYRWGVMPSNRKLRGIDACIIRKSIAATLGQLGDRRAIEPLRRLAAYPDPVLREVVRKGLLRLENV